MRARENQSFLSSFQKLICKALVVIYAFGAVDAPRAWAGMSDFFSSGEPRENEERRSGGFYSPQALKERLEYRERRSRARALAEKLGRSGPGRPEEGKSALDRALEEERRRRASLSEEAEQAKQKVFSLLGQGGAFNYVKYDDGRIVRFRDGQAVEVENERILDGRGNATLRHTDGMEYDGLGLLTAYQADETDSLGNRTHVKWSGATYTEDSVPYATDETNARKLLTGYVQETTDAFGVTTRVEWSGAAYNADRLLTGYRQKTTDAWGNSSYKEWSGGLYNSDGQVVEFYEKDRDALGNETLKHWTDAIYVRNPAFKPELEKEGVRQSSPEYLLAGYREETTDSLGLTTTRSWKNAAYDGQGNLESYDEELTDALGRVTRTAWRGGTTDAQGRLLSYEEVRTDLAGVQTRLLWQAETYSDQGRVTAWQEKRTDALGLETTVRRTEIQYRPTGEASAYKEEAVDAQGIKTLTERKESRFDSFGRITEYEENVTDDEGSTSRRHWQSGVYDAQNRLAAYEESWIDSRGIQKKREWSGTYDLYGRLDGYRESNADPFGNLTRKEWTAQSYDSADRILVYSQRTTDPDGNQTQTLWKAGREGTDREKTAYNAQGQVLAFDEIVTDSGGQTSHRFWENAGYDPSGNLTTYRETLVDPAGNAALRQWKDGTYDRKGRLMGFEEAISALSPDTKEVVPIQVHRWQAEGYDARGLLEGEQEGFYDAAGNLEARVRVSDSVYDDFGRRVESRTESAGADGVVHVTRRLGTLYDTRDREYGVEEIYQNDADPGISVTRSAERQTYDGSGRMVSGEIVTRTQGTDRNGNAVQVTRTETLRDAVLDQGRAVSLKRETVTQGRDGTGQTLDYKEEWTLNGITPSSEIQILRATGQGLDHTVVTRRTGILRNLAGQEVQYAERVFDEALSGGETVSERSRMVYNARNELAGYEERTFDLNGKEAQVAVRGTTYDGAGRVFNYQEERRSAGRTETLLRHETRYDALARVAATDESSLAEGRTQRIRWQAVAFDGKGRAQATRQEVEGAGADFPLAVTRIRTDQSGILYNRWGQVEGFSETVRDSSTPGLAGQSLVSRRTYDKFGAVASQEETRRRSGQGIVEVARDRTSAAALLTGKTLLLNDLNLTIPSSLLRGLHFSPSPLMGEGRGEGAKLELTFDTAQIAGRSFILNWDDLAPELRSQLLAGQEIEFATADGTTKVSLGEGQAISVLANLETTVETNRSGAVLDDRGRLAGYVETVHTTGGGLDRLETRLRRAIVYDLQGRVLSYQDQVLSSDAPEVVTTLSRSQIGYDPQDRIFSYREESSRKSEGGSLDIQEWTERVSTHYDPQDRETDWSEKSWSSQAPDAVQGTAWSGARYDVAGRLKGFVQETTRKSLADDTAAPLRTRLVREETHYNDLGQVDAQMETEENSWQPDLVTARAWNGILYDEAGRQDAFVRNEAILSPDGTLRKNSRTLRGDTLYDSQGRQTGYEEWQTSDDSPDVVQDVRREATDYDLHGQVSAYRETLARASAEETSQPLDIREDVRRNDILYDPQGRLAGYREQRSSTRDGSGWTEWRATHFDGLGRAESSVETGYRPEGGLYRKEWSGILDGAGRPSSFQEKEFSEGSGWAEREQRGREYDSRGLLVLYTESGSGSGSAGYRKQWSAENAGDYDAQGRLAAYRERFENDLGLVRLLERRETVYDGFGAAASVRESIRESAPGIADKAMDRSWRVTEGGWNDQGQVAASRENSSSEIRAPGSDLPEYRETVSTVRNGISYDPDGRAADFKETISKKVTDSEGKVIEETRSSFLRDAVRYDSAGRLSSYRESGEDPVQGRYERDWAAGGFDGFGRVSAYRESGFAESAGPFSLRRSNILYEDHGFVVGFDEEGVSNGNFMRRHWSAEPGQLDAMGRAGRWKEEGWNDNGSYRKERTASESDLLSRSTGYEERGFDAADGNTLRRVGGIRYDLRGRKSESQETVQLLDSGQVRETAWRGKSYSEGGQILSYSQSTLFKEGGQIREGLETHWAADPSDYSENGLLAGYSLSVERKSSDGNLIEKTVTQRSAAQYGPDGRLSGYREETVHTNAEGDASAQTLVRSEMRYYDAAEQAGNSPHREGMLASYRESALGTRAGEAPTQRIVSQIGYDPIGRRTDFESAEAEEDLLAGAVRRLADLIQEGGRIAETLEFSNFLSFSNGLAQKISQLWGGADEAFQAALKNALDAFSQASSHSLSYASQVTEGLVQGLKPWVDEIRSKVKEDFSGILPDSLRDSIRLSDSAVQLLRPFDGALTVTWRRGTEFDVQGRPVRWAEKSVQWPFIAQWSESDVRVSYDGASRRYSSYQATVRSGDQINQIVRLGYQYGTADRVMGYQELTWNGEDLKAGNQSFHWNALSESERRELSGKIVRGEVEPETLVTIKTYDRMLYDGDERLTEYRLATQQFGSEERPFEELRSLRETIGFYQDALGKREAALTEAQDELTRAWTEWEGLAGRAALTLEDPSRALAAIQERDLDGMAAALRERLDSYESEIGALEVGRDLAQEAARSAAQTEAQYRIEGAGKLEDLDEDLGGWIQTAEILQSERDFLKGELAGWSSDPLLQEVGVDQGMRSLNEVLREAALLEDLQKEIEEWRRTGPNEKANPGLTENVVRAMDGTAAWVTRTGSLLSDLSESLREARERWEVSAGEKREALSREILQATGEVESAQIKVNSARDRLATAADAENAVSQSLTEATSQWEGARSELAELEALQAGQEPRLSSIQSRIRDYEKGLVADYGAVQYGAYHSYWRAAPEGDGVSITHSLPDSIFRGKLSVGEAILELKAVRRVLPGTMSDDGFAKSGGNSYDRLAEYGRLLEDKRSWEYAVNKTAQEIQIARAQAELYKKAASAAQSQWDSARQNLAASMKEAQDADAQSSAATRKREDLLAGVERLEERTSRLSDWTETAQALSADWASLASAPQGQPGLQEKAEQCRAAFGAIAESFIQESDSKFRTERAEDELAAVEEKLSDALLHRDPLQSQLDSIERKNGKVRILEWAVEEASKQKEDFQAEGQAKMAPVLAALQTTEFQIAGQPVLLGETEIRSWVQGQAIPIGGKSRTLKELSEDPAVTVRSRLQETRSAVRTGIQYNAQGQVRGYQEIAWDGKAMRLGDQDFEASSLNDLQISQVLSGERVPEMVLGKDSVLAFSKVQAGDFTYGAFGTLQSQKLDVEERRFSSSGRTVRRWREVESDMTYDLSGRLEGRQKVTVEDGKTVTERTLAPFEYDAQGRIIRSDLERVESSEGVEARSEILTDHVQYDGLGRTVGSVRIVFEGEKATQEKTVAPIRYDGAGRQAYSKAEVWETSREALARGSEGGQKSIVELISLEYGDASGQATRWLRSQTTAGLRTTTLSSAQYDDQGRMRILDSRVLETGIGGSDLFRRYQVREENVGFYENGLVRDRTRLTTESDGRQVREESLDPILYDARGRVSFTHDRITEVTSEGSHSYETQTQIHSYDELQRVARQTRIVRDGGLERTESSQNTDDFAYDEMGRLKGKVEEVVERGYREDGAIAYERSQKVTEEVRRYDDLGRVMDQSRSTERSGEAGDRSTAEQRIHYTYSTNGQIRETASVDRAALTDPNGETKILPWTTSVTYVPAGQEGGRPRQTIEVRFEGEEIGSSHGPASWGDLSETEKDGIRFGEGNLFLDRPVTRTFQERIETDPQGRAVSWIANQETFGFIERSAGDWATEVSRLFGPEKAVTQEALERNFRNALWVDPSSPQSPVPFQELPQESKSAFLAMAQGSEPAGTMIGSAAIRLPAQEASFTVRLHTEFDSTGQAGRYQEIRGEVHAERLSQGTLEDFAKRAKVWESIAEGDPVESSLTPLIPQARTSLVTLNDLTYNRRGELDGWTSRQKDLRISSADRARSGVSAQVRLTLNRTETVERRRTVRNAIGQEIVSHELRQTGREGKAEVWNLAEYDGSGRAGRTMRMVLDPDRKTWRAEETRALAYVPSGTGDLVRESQTSIYDPIRPSGDFSAVQGEGMSDPRLDYSGRMALAVPDYARARAETETVQFFYGWAHAGRVQKTLKVKEDSERMNTGEVTDYFYAEDDSDPLYRRTEVVQNPLVQQEGDWDGGGTIRTREDAVLHYDALGRLSRLEALRTDGAGVRSAEETVFHYDLRTGRISQTDKALWNDTGLGLDVQSPRASGDGFPGADFLIYNGGGLKTREEEHPEYEEGRLAAALTLKTGSGGESSIEKSSYEYDPLTGRVSREISETIYDAESPGESDRSDLYRVTVEKSGFSRYAEGPWAGLPSGYAEVVRSSDAPGRVIEKRVESIRYDAAGRQIGSETTVSEKDSAAGEPGPQVRSYREWMRIGGDGGPGFDAAGRMVRYEKETEEGEKVTRETVSQTYSKENGLVLEINESIHETGGGLDHSYLRRQNFAYDPALSGGLPARETIVTQDGARRTTEEVLRFEYDSQRRVLSQDSTVTVQDATGQDRILTRSQVSIRNSGGFDLLGRPLKVVTTSRDSTGRVTTESSEGILYSGKGQRLRQDSKFKEQEGTSQREWEVTLDQTYDGLGRVASSRKRTLERGKETLEEASGLEYDSQGKLTVQLLDIEERDSETQGATFHRKSKVVTQNTYDDLGRVSAYRRQESDGIKTTTENASHLGYDRRERVLHSQAEFQELAPSSLDIRYSLDTVNRYGWDGKLQAQERLRIEGGLLIREATEFTGYDPQGRVLSQVSRRQESDVTQKLLNRSSIIQTQSLQYNDVGWATRMIRTTQEGEKITEEKILSLNYDRRGNVMASESEFRETGPGLDRRWSQTAQNESNALGQAVGYVKETREEGKIVREAAQNIEYDISGNTTDLESKITELDSLTGGRNLNHTISVETHRMEYNDLKQMMGYERTTMDGGKVTEEETRTPLLYDVRGRLLESDLAFKEWGRSETGELDHRWSVRTGHLKYNSLGQAIGYRRTTWEGSRETIEETLSPTLYDGQGRLVQNAIQVTERGEDTTGTLNNSYRVYQTQISFNDRGQVELSERRTVQGARETVERTRQTLDVQGRVSSYEKEFRVDDKRTLERTTAPILYDSLGRMIWSQGTRVDSGPGLLAETHWSSENRRYDAQGRLLSYQRKNTQWDGRMAGKTVEESTLEELEYNSLGQLVKSRVRIRETGETGQSETVHTPVGDRQTGILDHEVEVTQETSRYDGQGQVARYRRTTRDGEKTVRDRTLEDQRYDVWGRLIFSHTRQTEESKGVTKEKEIQMKDILYNRLGQTVRQTQVTGEYGRITTEFTEEDIRYDGLGRNQETRVHRIEDDTVGVMTKTEHEAKKISLYNRLGQAVEYSVTRDRDPGAPDRILTQQWSRVAYDSKGRTFSYELLSRNNATPEAGTFFTRLWTAYDGAGQVTSYDEVEEASILDARTGNRIDLSKLGKLTPLSLSELARIRTEGVTAVARSFRGADASGRVVDVGQGLFHRIAGQLIQAGVSAERASQIAAWVLDRLNGEFSLDQLSNLASDLLTSYADSLKTDHWVQSISYDGMGRVSQIIEQRRWGEIGGGGIQGLDTGWKNGTATVTTTYAYSGVSDRPSSEGVRAQGSGGYANMEIQRKGIDSYSVRDDIKYDSLGREVSSRSVTVQGALVSYSWIQSGTLTREAAEKGPSYSVLATYSTTENLAFDRFGRAQQTRTSSLRDDANHTAVREWTSDIRYGADGRRISAQVQTWTSIQRPENADSPVHGWTAQGLIQNWNGVKAGGAWRFSAGVAGNDNVRETHKKTEGRFQYDAFGNLDARSTEERSRSVSRILKDDGPGMTALGGLIQASFTAAQIVASAVPWGAVAILPLHFIQAAVFRRDVMEGLENSILQTGIGIVTNGIGTAAKALSQAQRSFVTALGRMATGFVGSIAQNATGDKVWMQAGADLLNLFGSRITGKIADGATQKRVQFGITFLANFGSQKARGTDTPLSAGWAFFAAAFSGPGKSEDLEMGRNSPLELGSALLLSVSVLALSQASGADSGFLGAASALAGVLSRGPDGKSSFLGEILAKSLLSASLKKFEPSGSQVGLSIESGPGSKAASVQIEEQMKIRSASARAGGEAQMQRVQWIQTGLEILRSEFRNAQKIQSDGPQGLKTKAAEILKNSGHSPEIFEKDGAVYVRVFKGGSGEKEAIPPYLKIQEVRTGPNGGWAILGVEADSGFQEGKPIALVDARIQTLWAAQEAAPTLGSPAPNQIHETALSQDLQGGSAVWNGGWNKNWSLFLQTRRNFEESFAALGARRETIRDWIAAIEKSLPAGSGSNPGPASSSASWIKEHLRDWSDLALGRWDRWAERTLAPPLLSFLKMVDRESAREWIQKERDGKRLEEAGTYFSLAGEHARSFTQNLEAPIGASPALSAEALKNRVRADAWRLAGNAVLLQRRLERVSEDIGEATRSVFRPYEDGKVLKVVKERIHAATSQIGDLKKAILDFSKAADPLSQGLDLNELGGRFQDLMTKTGTFEKALRFSNEVSDAKEKTAFFSRWGLGIYMKAVGGLKGRSVLQDSENLIRAAFLGRVTPKSLSDQIQDLRKDIFWEKLEGQFLEAGVNLTLLFGTGAGFSSVKAAEWAASGGMKICARQLTAALAQMELLGNASTLARTGAQYAGAGAALQTLFGTLKSRFAGVDVQVGEDLLGQPVLQKEYRWSSLGEMAQSALQGALNGVQAVLSKPLVAAGQSLAPVRVPGIAARLSQGLEPQMEKSAVHSAVRTVRAAEEIGLSHAVGRTAGRASERVAQAFGWDDGDAEALGRWMEKISGSVAVGFIAPPLYPASGDLQDAFLKMSGKSVRGIWVQDFSAREVSNPLSGLTFVALQVLSSQTEPASAPPSALPVRELKETSAFLLIPTDEGNYRAVALSGSGLQGEGLESAAQISGLEFNQFLAGLEPVLLGRPWDPGLISPQSQLPIGKPRGLQRIAQAIELTSDGIVGLKEGLVGTAVAAGLVAAPVLPYLAGIDSWEKLSRPEGILISAASFLFMGSYVGSFMVARRDGVREGIKFFAHSVEYKFLRSWMALGARTADDFGRYGLKDLQLPVRQSILNLGALVPILGNLSPSFKVPLGSPSAVSYSAGIHRTPRAQARSEAQAAHLKETARLPVVKIDYEYGTFTDVAMSQLNVENSVGHDVARQILKSRLAPQGSTLILTAHSGGIQASAAASKVLAEQGYGVGLLIGVAGPLGGILPTRYSNVGEIRLLGSSSEDPISALAQALDGNALDASGRPSFSNFGFRSGEGLYRHRDLGGTRETNPYLDEVDETLVRYLRKSGRR